MEITLRQLRALVEVARQKGFTPAAKRLDLTQSAVSHLINSLEAQVRVRLLDRRNRRIALTAAGAELVQNVERILNDLENTVSGLDDLVSKRRGRLTVAAPPVLAASLVPPAMARFKQAYPEMVIRLMDVLTDKILEAVRSGEADLGVGTFRKPEQGIVLDPLHQDRLMAVIPANHPLAKKRRVAWKDLQAWPLVNLSSGSAFHYLVYRAASQARASLIPAYEVGYMGTAIGLVGAGLGIAVLPAYARSLVDSTKAVMRLMEAPAVIREIAIARPADRSLAPAAERFATMLREICAQPGGMFMHSPRRLAMPHDVR